MKRPHLIGALCAAVFSVITLPSHATLVTIGTATYGGSDYQLIYDVEDQITWLDYSNSGATHPESLNWAASLNAALTINLYEGYSASWDSTDWRLPEASGYFTDNIDNAVTSSEMEDLYYSELGNELNDASLNFGDFGNLVSSLYYLEPNFPISPSYAPEFNFSNGTQSFVTSSVNSGIYGMAVISGEVSMVPIPAAVWLFASAVGALGFMRRKQRNRFQ